MPIEEPRMYSRTRPLPVDVVDPDHTAIHSDLEAWGRWNRDRGHKMLCGSAEGNYRAPWRQWSYPTTAEMMPRNLRNPRNVAVDRAVLHLPEQHRETVRRYYVFQQVPELIARKANIRYIDFGRWMRDCRCMVLNQLRRAETA